MLDGNDFASDVELVIYEVLKLADSTDDSALAERLRVIAKETRALIATAPALR